jgi:hypothetical protein
MIKQEAMEKIMIFGLAFLLEIMTAIPPQPMHRHQKSIRVTPRNDIEKTTSARVKVAREDSKPVKIYPTAELFHSPE